MSLCHSDGIRIESWKVILCETAVCEKKVEKKNLPREFYLYIIEENNILSFILLIKK